MRPRIDGLIGAFATTLVPYSDDLESGMEYLHHESGCARVE
jgi:hypothetical protein